MLKIKMHGKLYSKFEWDWPYPLIPDFMQRSCSYIHMSQATVETNRWGNFLRVSLTDTNGSYSGRMDYTFGKRTLLVYNEEELPSEFAGLTEGNPLIFNAELPCA